MRRYSLAALVVAMMALPVYGQPGAAPGAKEPPIVKGSVSAVTVYRGQALVTRVIDLPGGAGLSEVVVSELPDRLIASSLFAESADGVEVRSVSYRERPVEKDVRAEVQALDDQIKKIGDQIAANKKQQTVLAEQRTYLDKLSNFTAPTATVEMTKGVLNAEQLKTLTNYQFEQRKTIATEELALQNSARDLQEQLNLTQRKRNEITGNSSRTLREAIVFVNQEKAGSKLRLRYLVDSATWMPSYNIRADAEKKNATVEYQASIQQMSGEDWSNVKMTLSTASPSLVSSAPLLNPLTINLAARGGREIADGTFDFSAAQKELFEQRSQLEFDRNTKSNSQYGTISNSDNAGQPGRPPGPNITSNVFSGSTTITSGSLTIVNPNDRELNKLAEQVQILELVAKETRKDQEIHRAKPQEGIVVTYDLKNATTLPSRADRQLIQIRSVALKSEFYKLAVPVLTNYVYDQATLTNSGDTVLLGGPVASYVGGQFVGNGDIPTVAVGQNFTVGFGIDSSLRATRERIDRTEKIVAGNKAISYKYRIAVENFGGAPANVRILDRRPTAKETEVKISLQLATDQPKLSTDKDYEKFDADKGLLRWDVSVPPQQKRAEAFSITYELNLEYDKNLSISSSGAMPAPALEQMMHDLQKK